MRKTTIDGVEIHSPYLDINQASAYLGIGRKNFLRHADSARIPFSVYDKQKKQRRYHVWHLRRLARLMETTP